MTDTSASTTSDHLGGPGTTPRWPAGRYGRRREARRTPRVVIVLAALAFAVAGIFVGFRLFSAYGDGDYSASVISFGEVTDSQVVVTFQVRMPSSGTAICLVRARNAQGLETGRSEVTVQPGPDPSRTLVTHRLATRERPVTGEVQGCRPA